MTPEQALAAPEQHLILDEPPPQAHPEARTNKPERASIAYPDELTKRQVEVLRLVAQGLTNRQVADQLIISPRTVTTHLDHIYPKLGVNNRVQAVERGRTLGLLADLP